MSKVVFLNFPGHGHINPTLPVVRELIKRGEQVFYYASEEFRTVIEDTGASFRDYGGELPFFTLFKTNPNTSNIFYVIYGLLQSAEWVLEKRLAEIRDLQPDYIICDSFCPWGKCIAQILNVPVVYSITSIAINGKIMFSTPLVMLQRMMGQLTTVHVMKQAQAINHAISLKYGFPEMQLFSAIGNTGDFNIVYTSEMFQPEVQTFKQQGCVFVGPSLETRPQVPTFPFAQLDDRPLLYISLGTAFNKQPGFYRLCYEAFGDSKYQVVMSVGKHLQLDELGTKPANFIVQATVPQLEILQRASLFISHAGMNSVSESLYYGVPLILLPQSADQPWVAKRVEVLGAGKRLSPQRLTVQKLRSAAEEVFTQISYKQAAERIRVSFHEAGGYKRAADEILAYIGVKVHSA